MLDNSIILKTPPEIKKMEEGGKKLANVKKQLMLKVGEGVSAAEIEDFADRLIRKEGGEPSFKMVPGYHWATCVNVNEGIVHGIPKKEIVFKKGDIISVDLGIKYQGFHTDTY
ncbi:MAG: M24 family metallopeptidase, partial [Patescibacteria group bacterium]